VKRSTLVFQGAKVYVLYPDGFHDTEVYLLTATGWELLSAP
jgi:hypothetical protein